MSTEGFIIFQCIPQFCIRLHLLEVECIFCNILQSIVHNCSGVHNNAIGDGVGAHCMAMQYNAAHCTILQEISENCSALHYFAGYWSALHYCTIAGVWEPTGGCRPRPDLVLLGSQQTLHQFCLFC